MVRVKGWVGSVSQGCGQRVRDWSQRRGAPPWNAALLLGGYLLGENYRNLYDAIRPFELLIYAVVLLGGAYVLYRWLRGHNARLRPADRTAGRMRHDE